MNRWCVCSDTLFDYLTLFCTYMNIPISASVEQGYRFLSEVVSLMLQDALREGTSVHK